MSAMSRSRYPPRSSPLCWRSTAARDARPVDRGHATASSTSTAPATACRSPCPMTAGPGGGPGTLMQALPGGRPGPDVLARGGNNTWAPGRDPLGDKYFVYYSAPGTQPKSAIGLLVGKTLDPESPDYKWEDGGPVVWSDGVEDSNAIDPGVFRDPDQRIALADLRLLLRLHPPRRAQSEDRQTAVSRTTSRSTSPSTAKRRS